MLPRDCTCFCQASLAISRHAVIINQNRRWIENCMSNCQTQQQSRFCSSLILLFKNQLYWKCKTNTCIKKIKQLCWSLKTSFVWCYCICLSALQSNLLPYWRTWRRWTFFKLSQFCSISSSNIFDNKRMFEWYVQWINFKINVNNHYRAIPHSGTGVFPVLGRRREK